MGYAVPQDIAIASTDDIHSEIVLPIQLTSVGFDRAEYVKCAIDTLINNIKHAASPSKKEKEYVQKMIDVKLTIGQTT